MPDSSLIFSTSLFMCLFPSGKKKKKIRRWFTFITPCSFHVKGEIYTPVIPGVHGPLSQLFSELECDLNDQYCKGLYIMGMKNQGGLLSPANCGSQLQYRPKKRGHHLLTWSFSSPESLLTSGPHGEPMFPLSPLTEWPYNCVCSVRLYYYLICQLCPYAQGSWQ